MSCSLLRHPYAHFLSRFRLPITAISIGPSVNSPASAFRVSSRKYPPGLAIAGPFCTIAATTIAVRGLNSRVRRDPNSQEADRFLDQTAIRRRRPSPAAEPVVSADPSTGTPRNAPKVRVRTGFP
jgi:hypothetical protein